MEKGEGTVSQGEGGGVSVTGGRRECLKEEEGGDSVAGGGEGKVSQGEGRGKGKVSQGGRREGTVLQIKRGRGQCQRWGRGEWLWL